MRIIIISQTGKKLKLFAMAAFLWLVMFTLGSYLMDGTLQHTISIGLPTGPSRPLIEQFSNYDSPDWKFNFKYPTAFNIESSSLSGSDILFHLNLSNADVPSHGFVQVWNMPGDLGAFLNKSKETSPQTFKDFKQSSITVNGVKGYLWDYYILAGNRYYKGMEMFLKQKDRMYRLSYFVPEEKWDDRQAQIFNEMVKSFNISY